MYTVWIPGGRWTWEPWTRPKVVFHEGGHVLWATQHSGTSTIGQIRYLGLPSVFEPMIMQSNYRVLVPIFVYRNSYATTWEVGQVLPRAALLGLTRKPLLMVNKEGR